MCNGERVGNGVMDFSPLSSRPTKRRRHTLIKDADAKRFFEGEAAKDGMPDEEDEYDSPDMDKSNLSGCDAESGEGEVVCSQESCARTFVDGDARNRERDCAPLAATLEDLGEDIEAEEADKLANGKAKKVPIEPWEPGTDDGLSAKSTRLVERDEDKEIVKTQIKNARSGKGSNWELLDNED